MNSDDFLHVCDALVFLVMCLAWPWENTSTKATKIGFLILGVLNTIHAFLPNNH